MSQILDDLIATVTATEGVEDSAIAFAQGVPGLIQAAVTQALANGASAAELAPLTQLTLDLKAKSDALAAAITATPAPGGPTFAKKK